MKSNLEGLAARAMTREEIKALLKILGAPPGASLCTECQGRKGHGSFHTMEFESCAPCAGLGYWRRDQWFTPPEIVEASRQALGGFIDLDPFSCAEANRVVRAIRYFDQEDDGFAQDWDGRVYVNWPGQNERSAAKVLEQLPRVQAMVVHLFNFDSSTRWFHELLEQGPQVCIYKGRVKHRRPGGSVPGGGDRPSAALGFGTPEFREHFEPLGAVLDSLS